MSASTGKELKVCSVFRPNLFQGKVAVVTGGGTGIGKAITLELLYLGCNVVIASRQLKRLEQAAQEIRSWLASSQNPAKLDYKVCSIRSEEDVQALISHTIDTFRRLDFVVNNGGGQFVSPVEAISLKGWKAVLDTNLTGTFLMCREAYNQWMGSHGGAIVNITMDMWKGFPTMGHSGAARSGVDNLTKTMAIEWAQDGIRVNCVAPGSSIYSETAAANYGNPEVFEMIKKKIPAMRLGTVEEISSAVCYLLSPAANFITGDTIKVDAGQSLYNIANFVVQDHNKSQPYTWEKDVEALRGKRTSKL